MKNTIENAKDLCLLAEKQEVKNLQDVVAELQSKFRQSEEYVVIAFKRIDGGTDGPVMEAFVTRCGQPHVVFESGRIIRAMMEACVESGEVELKGSGEIVPAKLN